MLEETGTVVDVQADTLWVETISRSSCSHCSSGSCSTSVISKLFGLRRNLLQLDNTLNATQGDRVVIGIPDALLVRASIWAYLLPLLAMLLAAFVAVSLGADDSLQALLALLGLVGGFFAVRWFTGRRRQQQLFQPRLLRIEQRLAISGEFKGIRVM